MFSFLLQECLVSCLPPKSEVLDIYGRILINAFSINDNENQTIGATLTFYCLKVLLKYFSLLANKKEVWINRQINTQYA